MQNEPNFQKSQMNVSCYIKMDYEKRTLGERGKNEPKTNPIKAKTNPIKAKTNPIYPCVASGEAGSNPISNPKKSCVDNSLLCTYALMLLCPSPCQDKICNSLIDLALHCW